MICGRRPRRSGLIGALGEQSDRLARRPDGGSVPVQISAPESLPALPAAVEVAAYRIITEAMTNAARHSGASSIQARLECAARAVLRLEVRDNGGTSSSPGKRGIGVISIRERAAELGGSCQAGPDPDGGGWVAAFSPGATAVTATASARAIRSCVSRDRHRHSRVIADDHPIVRDGL